MRGFVEKMHQGGMQQSEGVSGVGGGVTIALVMGDVFRGHVTFNAIMLPEFIGDAFPRSGGYCVVSVNDVIRYLGDHSTPLCVP